LGHDFITHAPANKDWRAFVPKWLQIHAIV
jgi:hypothetical protein